MSDLDKNMRGGRIRRLGAPEDLDDAVRLRDLKTIAQSAGPGFISGGGGRGERGLQGPAGSGGGGSGTQGNQGVQGPGNGGGGGSQGPQGSQGNIGPQGFQGIMGAGFQGAQGLQGNIGPQGNQGIMGAGVQGAQGPQGNEGVQGFQGAIGVGVQGVQGPQGNQGFQGAIGAGVQGAQGVQGPQGLQGPQGNQGAQGNQGFQGFQGANTSEFGVVAGWGSPDVLTTTDNADFLRVPLPRHVEVNKLRATVETAPVGASIIIDVYLGTLTTGVLDGSPIGTITILAGAFYGEAVLAPVADWPTTKFGVPVITQVGSVTPGSTATITAECSVVP